MTFSIYTSCSLNYLPKARALAQSVRKFHPEALLTLCLNDSSPPWLDIDDEPFDQIWFPEELGYDPAWIFEHNVMELCTAVKGRALCRLLKQNAHDLQIYLDPDVYLFNSLEPVMEMMEGASIGLIPHILEPEKTELGIQLTELSIAKHGVYNLGHLFVRNDRRGEAFARWWASRLDKHCFDDPARGLFTDQRWVDLVPALFDGVKIIKNPALNVASWNLSQRKIRQHISASSSSFTVNEKPLLTYHFSGTGPTGTHRRVREKVNPENAAAAEIERIYENAIEANGQSALADHVSGYDTFADGQRISAKARLLFRSHEDLRKAFPNPYRLERDHNDYAHWLRSKQPDAISVPLIADDMMHVAYRDLFDEEYYLHCNPDVVSAIESGVYDSALDHYEAIGSSLLLDPNPFFVSKYYSKNSYHFRESSLVSHDKPQKKTLLWHYLSIGVAHGIEPIEFFDSHWYLKNYGDVQEAIKRKTVSSALAHFLLYGAAEGRFPSAGVDPKCLVHHSEQARIYLERHPKTGPFGALVATGGVAGRISVSLASN